MSGIEAKQVVKYTVMPGIIPRLERLFSSGFAHVAFLMAQIYAMVRLLPADHPYLNATNVGRFGLRHVIAEAANNLVFGRKNIDQIIIFGLLVFVVVLLAFQLVMLLGALFLGTSMAFAASTFSYPESSSFFVTENTTHDVAFMLLDRVFGVPDFFNSCVAQAVNCRDGSGGTQYVNGTFPWPFHVALHQFFRFYSTGILIIATIIFLYYIVVIVVETATSGTPFGQRFQNVWVPIRLIVAIGLLIPLPMQYSGGVAAAYSAGQYIVFAAAKYGSSLATNAWIVYNNTIYDKLGAAVNPIGESETLIALPQTPDMSGFVEAMSIIHTCGFVEFHESDADKNSEDGTGYPDKTTEIDGYIANNPIKPYLLKNTASWMGTGAHAATGLLLTGATTYQEALDFYYKGDIVIVFGRAKDASSNDISPASIEPSCGVIRIPIVDSADSAGGAGLYVAPPSGFNGAVAMQQLYFNMVRNAWFDKDQSETYIDFGGRFALPTISKGDSHPCFMGCKNTPPGLTSDGCGAPTVSSSACNEQRPEGLWRQTVIDEVKTSVETQIQTYWNSFTSEDSVMSMDAELLDRGWGGAGIWFNKLAQVNGNWMTAAMNTPTFDKFPIVMEKVREVRTQGSKTLDGVEMFNPAAPASEAASMKKAMADVTSNVDAWQTISYNLMAYWRGDQKDYTVADKATSANAFEDAMNMIFGTHGLFSMTKTNVSVHPLAQLSTLGRGLVETSIRNVALSSGSAAMGGLVGAVNKAAGAMVSSFAGMFSQISFIGLSAGLVLYYVVPFLPFVYFYFAVASWVKTIFEAMVGVPLWALAHLRLDGDGLAGDSAQNGYFLILEVFIRPILTVFGLLAAMFIFTAQVRVLNSIWGLAIENVGGVNAGSGNVVGIGELGFRRGIVDQFFFTVTYAIVVYMMATAAFKLIDTIPDNIMRWAGSNASSFGDINQDPTDQMTRYVALGGLTAGREAAKGIQAVGTGTGSGLGGILRGISGR